MMITAMGGGKKIGILLLFYMKRYACVLVMFPGDKKNGKVLNRNVFEIVWFILFSGILFCSKRIFPKDNK